MNGLNRPPAGRLDDLGDLLRAILGDDAAGGGLSAHVRAAIVARLIGLGAERLGLSHNSGNQGVSLMTPKGGRSPLDDLTDEEREWLRGLARAGAASRKVWRMLAWLFGGLAALMAFIAAVQNFAHLIGLTK